MFAQERKINFDPKITQTWKVNPAQEKKLISELTKLLFYSFWIGNNVLKDVNYEWQAMLHVFSLQS